MPLAKGNTSWLQHVANGEAYSIEDFIIGVGGMFNHVQLFNPVGSGRRLRLRSANHLNLVVIGAHIRRHDVPLTILGPPAPFAMENLLGGGPLPVAEVRSDRLAVVTGSAFWLIRSAAFDTGVYPPKGMEWGHDLLPGQGILMNSVVVGGIFIINWQWVELPI